MKVVALSGGFSRDAANERLKRPFPDGAIVARLAWAYVPSPENNKAFGNAQSFVAGNPKNGVQIPAEMIHYGMTKTAQLAVSRGLAELCAGTGVTVTAVLPGPTRSDGVNEFVNQLSGGKPFEEFEKEFFTTVRPTSLLKRFATTEDTSRDVLTNGAWFKGRIYADKRVASYTLNWVALLLIVKLGRHKNQSFSGLRETRV